MILLTGMSNFNGLLILRLNCLINSEITINKTRQHLDQLQYPITKNYEMEENIGHTLLILRKPVKVKRWNKERFYREMKYHKIVLKLKRPESDLFYPIL
jgi:hypothetical protein